MTDSSNKRDDGSVREEVSAFGERTKGAAKDAIGSMTGNTRLEREGEAENAEGRERQARNDAIGGPRAGGVSGTIGEELSATGERIKGAAKDATGAVLDNPSLEREGERERAEGRARQAANDVIPDRTAGSATTTNRFVTGLYHSPEHAGRAYDELTNRHGYRADDISVVMSDDTKSRHFRGDHRVTTESSEGSKAAEGAGVGGGIGIGVGAALGALLAGATTIALPGIGLAIAGPIAGAIAGAGAGGAAGSLIGALVGAGIPEDRAKVYEKGIRDGGIVIGTRARDEAHAAELERDFIDYGGRDVLR